jgi:hypothetical protein
MSTTFRAWIFTSFYFGVLLFMTGVGFFLRGMPEVRTWGPLALTGFGIFGLPWLWARVEMDEHGIMQKIVRRRFIAWADMLSWERVGHPGSDGPETITITSRAGSVRLNHNCVYGRRLDLVEAELRRRIAQPAASPNGGPATPRGNSRATEGPPSVS